MVERLKRAPDWSGLVVRWWLGRFKWISSKTRLVSSGSFKDDFPSSYPFTGPFLSVTGKRRLHKCATWLVVAQLDNVINFVFCHLTTIPDTEKEIVDN